MICQHLKEAAETAPQSTYEEGCAECHAAGLHNWVHLRLCLGCGHVACCDSSPLKHMTAHHEATGHPVMRSYEPGESWRWCYLDEHLG